MQYGGELHPQPFGKYVPRILQNYSKHALRFLIGMTPTVTPLEPVLTFCMPFPDSWTLSLHEPHSLQEAIPEPTTP